MSKITEPATEFLAISKPLVIMWGVIFGSMYHFIDSHIWSPAEAYILTMGLVMVDQVTDTILKVQQGKFCFRAARMEIFTIAAYTVLLFFSFQFSKFGGILPVLTHLVFVPIVLLHFVGLVNNFYQLGLIKKDLAEAIKNKFTSKIETHEHAQNP